MGGIVFASYHTLYRCVRPQAGCSSGALSSGDFEITEVQGCDGINDRVYAGTHEPKDPAKTMRIPINVRELPSYVLGRGCLTHI
jgi:hypothetical protein